MPISAEQERILLNHYHLTTLDPTEWPKEHDDDEDSDPEEDESLSGRLGNARRASMAASIRYKNINRHASLRSSATSRSGGKDAAVQKDEPDALGLTPSVAAELRKRGLPVEQDLNLRNRFMLSSTTFSPALYLSHVHQNASTSELLRGLDFLSRSIEQKSASLKILVESNFERFVRAKATIDSVYTEMRTQGVDQAGASPVTSTSNARPHSRHASRGQTHFRNNSGPFGSQSRISVPPSDKKKTALTKESEYGVSGIKAPLLEVAIKAEEVWGPELGGREKEETLKAVMSALDQHRDLFRLGGTIHESIKKNDYDGVIEAYKQAKQHVDKARRLANSASDMGEALSEAEVHQIILTARMWHDVTVQVEEFKAETWKRLKHSHGRKLNAGTEGADKEQYMELIGLLLQLGVDENPIWEWINSRYLYLKDRIMRSFERSRIDIEIQRRKLTHITKVDNHALALYLRSASNLPGTLTLNRKESTRDMDSPAIIAFWEKVQSALTALLSSTNGILGEVLEWWEIAQSFIANNAQKSFPVGVFAAGLEHLQLDPDHIQNIREGAVKLFDLIREAVNTFFAEPPAEDLSELYSPASATPSTPNSARSPVSASRKGFPFDLDSVQAQSPAPKRDGTSEKFAFWAPGSNSLSSSHYLAKLLVLVGSAAGEMASLEVVKKQPSGVENLKVLVTLVRERCISALCAAWLVDAERSRVLETWHRSPERRDLTLMPIAFEAWMEKVLSNIQKMAYLAEAKKSGEVVVPPPMKLLSAVRSTFVTGLYKGLSGMVESAEGKTKGGVPKRLDDEADGVIATSRAGKNQALRTLMNSEAPAAGEMTVMGMLMEAVDGDDKNVRLLLTLSNFAHLRSVAIPRLITHFETLFSVKLTDESKTLRDVLAQIDTRLFQSYTTPTNEKLKEIITAGITSPTWSANAAASNGDGTPSKPKDVQPYVYSALLTLVLVHAEITSTIPTSSPSASSSSSSLTSTHPPTPIIHQILANHLLHASQTFLSAFRTRQKFTLHDLIQATLDVEFFSQTLKAYASDAATTAQSNLYLVMDERTDHDARSALQGSLTEMQGALKRLKESTRAEFACFKQRTSSGRTRGGTNTGDGERR